MVSRADGFRKGPNSTPGTSGRMKRCSRRWCVILGCHRANSRTSKPGDRGCRSCRRPPTGPPAPGQEAGVRRRLPARPPRAAGRRDEVLNGLWLLPAKKMRLMIQIPAFLEILISCFLSSNEVGFSRWASRPGGAPRNRSPSGWRTEGKLTGLVEGMPNVSPTWSPGRTDFAKGRTQRPGLRAG